MLKKAGRWIAGRVQGSKGVRKYDDWMQRNPLAGTALDVAGYAGLAAATPWALGKLSAAKGGAMLSGAPKVTNVTSRIMSAAPAPVTSVSKAAMFTPPTALNAASGGSRIAGLLKGARENWDIISGVGNAVGGVMDAQAQQGIAQQNARRLEQEFGLREREFEDRRRREDEARENRRRITMLLMPVLQKELAAYGSPTTPTMG